MNILNRYSLAACVLLGLTACGGGGSSGSGNDTSSSATPGNNQNENDDGPRLELSPEHVDLSATEFGEPFDQTQVLTAQVHNLNRNVYVDFTWSDIAIESAEFYIEERVQIIDEANIFVKPRDPQTLYPGIYYDEIVVVGCLDANCDEQIEGSPAYTTFKYTNAAEFGYVIDGDPPPQKEIDFYYTENAWSATSDQPWLKLDSAAGEGAATVKATADIAGLEAGDYSATITFTDNETGEEQTLDTSLAVRKAQVFTSAENIVLGGANGVDYSPRSIQLATDTGSREYPWTLSVSYTDGSGWLIPDIASGTVSAAEPSPEVEVNSDRTGMSAGSYQARIRIDVDVNGDIRSATVPVTLNLSSHNILATDNGVALASTPSHSVLTAETTIVDSYELTSTPWQAVSDQPWLSVTSSGVAGGQLMVTADPAGLVSDQVHTANVTITSSDPSVENSETLRVGLWVGTAGPAERDEIEADYDAVTADPVKPYVYAASGSSPDIDIYNVYTAQKIGSINDVGTEIAYLATSTNGSRLFVSDLDADSIIEIDLDTLTVVNSKPVETGEDDNLYLAYGRVGGEDVVYTSNRYGYLVSADTLVEILRPIEYSNPFRGIAASTDGTTVCGAQEPRIYCQNARYADLDEQTLILSDIRATDGLDTLGWDLALSANGSTLYGVALYEFRVVETSDMSESNISSNAPYTNNVDIDSSGRLLAGANSLSGTGSDTWVYSPGGTLLQTLALSGTDYGAKIKGATLVASGDTQRIIAATTDSGLVLVNAP